MKKLFTTSLLILSMIFLIGCGSKSESKNFGLSVFGLEKFSGLDKPEDNIKINLNGKIQDLSLPIYLDKNRYLIPISEIIKNNNGKFKIEDDSLNIKFENKDIKVNLKDNTWTNLSKEESEANKFKIDPIIKDDTVYMSLIDFVNIFDLKSRWNSKDKLIKLYNNKDMLDVKPYKGKGSQKGIIRFEDVASTGTGTEYDSQYLETIRVMGRYLDKKNVPYHIAWIPRYIDPEKKIDNDPSKENNFANAELVYTLDFVASHKGEIGLHGYTHQIGNTISGHGFEFGKYNPSVEDLKSRVSKALQIAKDLDIKINFFEAPHYTINKAQNEALEKNFKYIFNDYDENKAQSKPMKSPTGSGSYYVPTPLYYIEGGKENDMLNKIKNMSNTTFAGMFYHPFLEAKLIDFKDGQDGYPEDNYKKPSIIQKVIDEFEKRNVSIISIEQVSEK